MLFDAFESTLGAEQYQSLVSALFQVTALSRLKRAYPQPTLHTTQGTFKDYVQCDRCKNENSRRDRFLDLSLDIMAHDSLEVTFRFSPLLRCGG